MALITKGAKPTNPTQRTVLIGIVLLMATFAGLQYFAQPLLIEKRTTAAVLRSEVDRIAADTQELKNAEVKLRDAVKAFEQSGRTFDIKRVDDVVPPTEDIPGLYNAFSQLEQQVRLIGPIPSAADLKFPLYLLKYQVGQPADGSSALTGSTTGVTIPVAVTVSGDYARIKTIIERMQTMSRPITISQVNLGRDIDNPQVFTAAINGYARAQQLSPEYLKSAN
jgi:hypothetical protein